MDVLIKLELPDESVTLTFSGYSGAKVADGKLSNPTWPMRKLADLQDNGFPLNGERVLYDPNTSASQANGKLGVRGNIGETVTVTVTGNKTITALTVFASGAASVTHNGTTTNIIANQAIIPVGARTITLTFNPVSESKRIEVSEIQPGTVFRITNENLIRAIVSLRSDLSLFDQSLPESELNVEIYSDADISEIVASIPNDTPVTYSAGYPDDMSTERLFYVSDQVTWADKVLTIRAVDAVHFLDNVNLKTPVEEEYAEYFWNGPAYVLGKAGVSFEERGSTDYGDKCRWMVKEGTNGRSLIAYMNQLFNMTDTNGYLKDGSGRLETPLQFTYVDAGRPKITWDSYYRQDYTIKEEDCANITKNVDIPIGSVRADHTKIMNPTFPEGDAYAQKIGSATFIKNVGTSLTFDKYSYEWLIGLYLGEKIDNDIAKKLMNKYGVVYGLYKVMPVVPATDEGSYITGAMPQITDPFFGGKLAIGEIAREDFLNEEEGDIWWRNYPYSAFVPWSQGYSGWRYDNNASHMINTASQMWNVLAAAGVIDSGSQTLDLDIYGCAMATEPTVLNYKKDDSGGLYDYGETFIVGQIKNRRYGTTSSPIETYPAKALASPMYKSRKTGSFRWKGNPRHQPRDILTIENIDGTETEVTIESITITHEGGGTYADYTYREGVI